jgi:ribosomal protein S18 acetylase RimI-like enzyme
LRPGLLPYLARRRSTVASLLHIRNAAAADRDTVATIVRTSYREFAKVMEPSAWEGLREAVDGALRDGIDRAEVILAELDGEAAGCVFLYPPHTGAYGDWALPADSPEIRLLSVLPTARGHGVGRALTEECIRRARERGAHEVGLHTSRSMRAAIDLYASMGFERRPDLDFHPAGAEPVLGYRLRLGGSGGAAGTGLSPAR